MRTYTSKSLTKTRTLELFRFLINFGTLSVSDIIKLTNLLISLRYRGLLMFFSFLLFLVSTFDRKNLKLLLLLHCGYFFSSDRNLSLCLFQWYQIFHLYEVWMRKMLYRQIRFFFLFVSILVPYCLNVTSCKFSRLVCINLPNILSLDFSNFCL